MAALGAGRGLSLLPRRGGSRELGTLLSSAAADPLRSCWQPRAARCRAQAHQRLGGRDSAVQRRGAPASEAHSRELRGSIPGAPAAPRDSTRFCPRTRMSTSGQSPVAVAARRGMGFLAEMEALKEQGSGDAGSALDFESPLEVVLYPDPRLRAPNKLVTNFADPRLPRLVDEMLDVMYKTDGVGLSAPQVGVNVRLMVYNPAGERGEGQEYVLINPRIVKSMKATAVESEGCLSFPKIYADVERPLGVKVEAQDLKGRKFSLNIKHFQARIFQHEYDHLQGTLFFDRMTPEVVDTIRTELLSLEALYEEKSQQKRPETVGQVQAIA